MADRKANVLEKLAEVRQALLEMVAQIEAEAWERKVFSESEEWRVSDLFRHVVGAEPSMARLIENIRDGGQGASPDFDLARWNDSRVKKSRHKTIADLTADLTKNRADLLEVVDTLDEDDWDKQGLHGSLEMMTIEEILHRIADHEAHHMADIQQAVT
jgi:uncharacterized protein (TIGR03083 family)